jgi:cellulose synthase/poly-beta-1,6-N-acetylglucosamine synthase-like glycosyltransferase
VTLATIWSWLFVALTWILALGWLRQLLMWLGNSSRVADLTHAGAAPLRASATPLCTPAKPDLAVIVPACNEEASIAATLRSLLASQGLSVQVIAVNDRSSDRTGEIMAAEFQNFNHAGLSKNPQNSLQILHIEALPEGWLGKPHALAKAAELTQADWILFTDGDVLFDPRALALTLRYVQAEQADHLVLMPDWIMASPGEAAMHGAMHALSTWTLHLWRVADPQARDFLGVGAFNLVRREVYETLGGFAALRMEVLEDLRFGWKLKRAGYRQRVVLGPGLAAVRWSQGAWGVVRNLEKNLFALYRFKTGMALFACLGLVMQIAVPLAAIWIGGWARLGAIVLYASIIGLYVASRRVTRVSPWYVLAYPLAVTLFLFAHVRSAGLALWRHGILWRGTLYPLKELRAHAGRFWSSRAE